jgi:hypothetical protein
MVATISGSVPERKERLSYDLDAICYLYTGVFNFAILHCYGHFDHFSHSQCDGW